MSVKSTKKSIKDSKIPRKAFNIRLNKDLWYFLKQSSLDQEISVNEIVNKCLQKYRDRQDRA